MGTNFGLTTTSRLHGQIRTVTFELFGIEPVRGDDPLAPAAPDLKEEVYISQLLRVYGELTGAGCHIGRTDALGAR